MLMSFLYIVLNVIFLRIWYSDDAIYKIYKSYLRWLPRNTLIVNEHSAVTAPTLYAYVRGVDPSWKNALFVGGAVNGWMVLPLNVAVGTVHVTITKVSFVGSSTVISVGQSGIWIWSGGRKQKLHLQIVRHYKAFFEVQWHKYCCSVPTINDEVCLNFIFWC